MIRPALLLSAAALFAAGCGGSKTVTQVQTVARQPVQAQSTPTTATVPKIQIQTPTTQAPPPPAASGGTLPEAQARVSAEGYNVDDPGAYDSSHTLRVLVGTKKSSGDGYAKRAFFFVGGRYIGTDTSDDSAGVRVEGSGDTTVTLAYALYGPNDALCCPGGTARVRYQWNGSRLVPLDPIPSASKRG
ncbi:MAG: hypothetical protein QOF37_2975 [Thermoleophilaceae bacterium]|nr:hypothetical protein [Thermoleophilaceae bacterium]